MDRSLIGEKLAEYIKSRSDMTFYQTHTWEGQKVNEGIMGCEKNNYILSEDIIGKTILDLGCATGATLMYALEHGAKKVIGIDNLLNNIVAFNDMADICGFKNKVKTYCFDLSEGVPVNAKNVDVVFCFAITQYVGYRKIWNEIPKAKVIYLMGGVDSGYNEKLLSCDGWSAEFLAEVPNNNKDNNKNRKIYRLTRNG